MMLDIAWDGHSEYWMGLEHSMGWVLEHSMGWVLEQSMGWAFKTLDDKSKILYIPWKVSWPLSRLVSDDAECVRRDISWSEYFPFLPMTDNYGPNQHELHISTLISGTTLWSHTSSHLWPALWWKATEVVDNEPPDCVPQSIVLRVGGLRTEMSFLGCTGWLTAGSGLQQLLEVVFAQNSVTHMLTAKPSPEQFEDIFLQMLSLMLNSIECE